ncbi:hypothetical protein L207DRAFT_635353 [Hyaloscypha variabilis F]|uniref:Nephrocystin 3-like N-terminal domain-containing protein n=1 Tax=Hyaloscypha variabilis (strain UAMH 11265 / GT02V1 / F) TaxID=1149755 RepID=A0A2J6RHC2_HYAVF|nr:hypothetical protein L207DRAFT_635353 [Hyaloscypha variabilis F]
MDPLSALTVAAAVVQFVDYGTKIVSKGRELYKSVDGALSENIEFKTASGRLQRLSSTLQESLYQGQQGMHQRPLNECDQALDSICNSCIEFSKDLVTRLEKLKVPGDSKHRKWGSLKQSIKSVWSEEKIEETATKLAKFRSELDTHVILSLRKQATDASLKMDERFTSLDTDMRKIIEILLDDRTAAIALHKSIEALSLSVKKEHEVTRAARSVDEEDFCKERVELSLLESLRFETINYRHESIALAHRRTFEWIFRDPEPEGKPWRNFCQWLESGTGIYWINGKAGSGKSTLIRFILDDTRTRTHLKKWAKNGAVEFPTFFFWNSGTLDQRSQVGLFRSILYNVLEKHKHLIPVVFPEDWRKGLKNARHGVQVSFGRWSLSRLKTSFEQLILQSSENLRFCS